MSRQRRREDCAYTFAPWAEALELAPARLNVHAATQMIVDAGLATVATDQHTAEPAEQDSTELISMEQTPANVT